jgi:exoribonuclease-2
MRPRLDHQRSDLEQLARRAMIDRGLRPDFEPAVLQQVARLDGPAEPRDASIRDLTALPWFSIDNDDSRDLDQLTVAEPLDDGATRIRIAIADVDSLVEIGSPVDLHARHNTTSVYTGCCIFAMLPERLSTDLTSLNPGEVRLAMVVDFVVDGGIRDGAAIYRAAVFNHAKLAYPAVGAWLEGKGALPRAASAVPGLDEQLRLQDAVAQRLRRERRRQGALDFQTIEARPVFAGEKMAELRVDAPDRAKELIEDLMVAANGITARYLEQRGYASIRRVVRSPNRWQRIVAVAREHGSDLPAEPDSGALEEFLHERRRADPLRFPDLSLVIVKLMGAGEYVVETPGGPDGGHFGLAVGDYAHSTAPNRRYPDLITQRLLKAALLDGPSPYSVDELAELAKHCTRREDDANKVERQVRKSSAALLLETRLGESFDAVVTGASDKGTWVRVLRPPVEGRVVRGFQGLDVGDEVRVELVGVDVERGFIDFARRVRGS